MKKIDFHIHTLPSIGKEEEFEFDLGLLEQHVANQKLDAIAITNHNFFNRDNYRRVKIELEKLSCKVFPGVELDVMGTHILLITDDDFIDELEKCCDAIDEPIRSVEEFAERFPILEQCLVIPHYGKEPSIREDVLKSLSAYVDAVEASSPKKAIRISKTKAIGVPVVCFTDFRFGGNGKPNPKSVYISTDTLDIPCIKAAMKADRGVRYNIDGTEQLEIAPGILASDALNLIIGRRSTGKTYTLEKVRDLCDEQDVYYIKQGSLVANSTESEFKKYVSQSYSSNITKYYQRWIPLLKDAQEIGCEATRKSTLKTYLDSLKRYAESSTMADAFSRCRLFKAVPMEEIDCTEVMSVTSALVTLLQASSTKEIIDKYISEQTLLNALKDVVRFAKDRQIEAAAVSRANKISQAIKRKLTVESSQDKYPVPVLSQVTREYAYFQKCESLLAQCWTPREVYDDNGSVAEKYSVHVMRCKYSSASSIKQKSGIQDNLGRLASAKPHEYFDKIIELGNSEQHPAALFDLNVQVWDKKGTQLSGGQRTEFIFMDKLSDAESYPVILIDEPESSFDNIFLDEHIASKIKELALHATVFVSSHNQVLSFALSPDKVFYTDYDSNTEEYLLYSAEPVETSMTNQSGENVPTRETVMRLLEASPESYERRKDYYEGA